MTSEATAIAQTRAWVEHAVIGLNLCPFAKAVTVRGQVRYAVSTAADWEALRADFCRELELLMAADPQQVDTTLLICTEALADFDDYNDFLEVADDALAVLDLEGVVQVASFHPHYRFEGTSASDVTNATNRSPWPVLQLLREDSVEQAVAAVPDPDAIYQANLQTLETLGEPGWLELSQRWSPPEVK